MWQKIVKNRGIEDFARVDFKQLNIFNTKSRKRIPKNCKRAIAMIFPYRNEKAFCGNISAYCAVEDYHVVVRKKTEEIIEKLKEKWPEYEFVPFVDASPIDEIDMCLTAGLGVKGENSLLITPKYGSYVFIGEILTDMPVECVKYAHKSCIHCGRCKNACPGGAICEKGIKREKCASFISQKKGELTKEEEDILKKAHTVFGCDICQRVCPMNKNIKIGGNLFDDNIINTVTYENIDNLYKKRAFGFRGKKVLERNLKIYFEQV
jgi:epoxyqueuosine reductase